MAEEVVREVIALSPKVYSLITEDQHVVARHKGVPRRLVNKQLKHELYRNALYNFNGTTKTNFLSIRAENFENYTTKVTRSALNRCNLKRYFIDAEFSLPWGCSIEEYNNFQSNKETNEHDSPPLNNAETADESDLFNNAETTYLDDFFNNAEPTQEDDFYHFLTNNVGVTPEEQTIVDDLYNFPTNNVEATQEGAFYTLNNVAQPTFWDDFPDFPMNNVEPTQEGDFYTMNNAEATQDEFEEDDFSPFLLKNMQSTQDEDFLSQDFGNNYKNVNNHKRQKLF
jgi:hypothetical protein